jgi:hypothetical protein
MVLSALVVMLPDSAISKMGLLEIRDNYLGGWWLLLIFSTAIWIVLPLSKIKDWWGKRCMIKARFDKLQSRMQNLDGPEREWLRYCLYFNVQTATALRTNPVPQSLVNKGILIEGSGQILNLPFHINDDAWLVTQANMFEFISAEEMESDATADELNQFMREMKRV